MVSPVPEIDDLTVGPLTVADAPALLALFHTYDRRFFGEGLMDADDLLSDLQAPDFDPATDSLAYRTPAEELVAAGFLTGRNRIEAQFAEGWEDSALRSLLVDFAEARARERRMDFVEQFLAADDDAGALWLTGRGYRLHHTAWILSLGAQTPIAGRTLPPDYAVRPFSMSDAEALHRVIVDAFAEWDDGPAQSFPVWRAATFDRANVDPSAFRIATHHGQVIGGCTVFDSAGEAWVSHLAVDQAHRRRGVAQQLLADAYAAARARGVPNAGLSTDTRTGALDLYLRLGMRVKFTLDNWQLPL